MQFDGFEIHSVPYLRTERNCKCGGKLHIVSNGFLSECFFCEKCESVYLIKMVKCPKIKWAKSSKNKHEKKLKSNVLINMDGFVVWKEGKANFYVGDNCR